MRLTKENHKYISQVYLQGATIRSIAKNLKVCPLTIRNSLIKNEIKVNSKLRHTKHVFDKNKFDIIDSGDKAYWLGFLLGDGSVDGKNASLHIELSQIDKNHLIKLKEFMNGTQEIILTKKKCCRIIFCGVEFIASLKKYGLIKNKTYTVKTPNISKEYLADFYRGILDSDGWITKHGDQHEFGFSSANEKFLIEIKTWINQQLNKECGYLKQRIRKNKHQVWQLIIGGNNNFKAISDLIYQEPKYFLNRKNRKINKFLNEIN